MKRSTAALALAVIEGRKTRREATERIDEIRQLPAVSVPLSERIDAKIDDTSGHLIVTLDGERADLGRVRGRDGDPGKDGVGIADISLNKDDELVIRLTNGRSLNVGKLSSSGGVNGLSVFYEQGRPERRVSDEISSAPQRTVIASGTSIFLEDVPRGAPVVVLNSGGKQVIVSITYQGGGVLITSLIPLDGHTVEY